MTTKTATIEPYRKLRHYVGDVIFLRRPKGQKANGKEDQIFFLRNKLLNQGKGIS